MKHDHFSTVKCKIADYAVQGHSRSLTLAIESAYMTSCYCQFSLPLSPLPPSLRVIPFQFLDEFHLTETRFFGLPVSEDCAILAIAVLIQYYTNASGSSDGGKRNTDPACVGDDAESDFADEGCDDLADDVDDLGVDFLDCKYDLRKHYFTNRVVPVWNSLPNNVVMADNINIFKNRLDKFWSGNG